MINFLVFSWNEWDDDKGPGWHSLSLKSEADTVEGARREFELKVPELARQGLVWEDYHIVSLLTLEIVEEGKTNAEWDENGRYYTKATLSPDGVEITEQPKEVKLCKHGKNARWRECCLCYDEEREKRLAAGDWI